MIYKNNSKTDQHILYLDDDCLEKYNKLQLEFYKRVNKNEFFFRDFGRLHQITNFNTKIQSCGLYDKKIKLYSAEIKNSFWDFNESSNETNHFFNIEPNKVNNHKFFVANPNEVERYLDKIKDKR